VAKTYNSIPSVATGDVYTATAHNNIVTNVNNYRVPPACRVRIGSNVTSYLSQTNITWTAEDYDTDDMWASGTTVTVNTAGLYLLTFTGAAEAGTSWSLVQPRIKVGGTNIASAMGAAFGTFTGWSLSVVVSLAATNAITADLNCAGSGSFTLSGAASPNAACTLSAVWLGQVS
jgi:hypothetical protein